MARSAFWNSKSKPRCVLAKELPDWLNDCVDSKNHCCKRGFRADSTGPLRSCACVPVRCEFRPKPQGHADNLFAGKKRGLK
jgi:hypothetical protein